MSSKKAPQQSELSENKEQKPAKAKKPRASNDPRKKPKPVVDVEVSTERLEKNTADTSADVTKSTPAPKKKAPVRVANDPRKKRSPAKPKTDADKKTIENKDNIAESSEENSVN